MRINIDLYFGTIGLFLVALIFLFRSWLFTTRVSTVYPGLNIISRLNHHLSILFGVSSSILVQILYTLQFRSQGGSAYPLR